VKQRIIKITAVICKFYQENIEFKAIIYILYLLNFRYAVISKIIDKIKIVEALSNFKIK
jgi:hypothetical protein